MRTLLLINITILSLLLVCCSTEHERGVNGAKSQEELLEIIREAVQQRDVDAIMRLGYWENVPERMKNGIYRQIPNCFDYNEPNFHMRKMSLEERQAAKAHGETYVWNIEPFAYLVIEGSDAEDGSLSIPIGVRDGQYHIASRYPKN